MKSIKGFEGIYSITEDGRIISHSRSVSYAGKKNGVRVTKEKEIKTYPCRKTGRKKVRLNRDGKRREFYIHKLYEAIYGK